MFDFIRKDFLWRAWDEELHRDLDPGKASRRFGFLPGRRARPPALQAFHLKSIQDLAVYDQLRDLRGKCIAEAGGGHSRILPVLAKQNTCTNIDRFEGQGGGPDAVREDANIRIERAFLGDFSTGLEEASFDAVCSVSVIEHIPGANLQGFLEDGLRILKPGGLWLHAIDLYLEDHPQKNVQARFDTYRNWMSHAALAPVGVIYEGPPKFSCDMATNPDNVMHLWGEVAPNLIDLRRKAQSVSIIMAACKR